MNEIREQFLSYVVRSGFHDEYERLSQIEDTMALMLEVFKLMFERTQSYLQRIEALTKERNSNKVSIINQQKSIDFLVTKNKEMEDELDVFDQMVELQVLMSKQSYDLQPKPKRNGSTKRKRKRGSKDKDGRAPRIERMECVGNRSIATIHFDQDRFAVEWETSSGYTRR